MELNEGDRKSECDSQNDSRPSCKDFPGFYKLFNDPCFSDRILVFEEKAECSSLIPLNRKRARVGTRSQAIKKVCLENREAEVKGGGNGDDDDGSGGLCDENSRQFHVSSAILAGSSNYFKSLFGGGFSEQFSKEVEMGDLVLCEWLLKYIYADLPEDVGDSDFEDAFENLTLKQLFKLLLLADRFDISRVHLAVFNEVKNSKFSIDKCNSLLLLPESISKWEEFLSVIKQMDKYLKGICGFILPSHFGDFTAELVKHVLTKFNFSHENDLWTFVTEWAKCRPAAQGTAKLESLLSSLRYHEMDAEFLIFVVKRSKEYEIFESVRKSVQTACDYKLVKTKDLKDELKKDLVTARRDYKDSEMLLGPDSKRLLPWICRGYVFDISVEDGKTFVVSLRTEPLHPKYCVKCTMFVKEDNASETVLIPETQVSFLHGNSVYKREITIERSSALYISILE